MERKRSGKTSSLPLWTEGGGSGGENFTSSSIASSFCAGKGVNRKKKKGKKLKLLPEKCLNSWGCAGVKMEKKRRHPLRSRHQQRREERKKGGTEEIKRPQNTLWAKEDKQKGEKRKQSQGKPGATSKKSHRRQHDLKNQGNKSHQNTLPHLVR